MADQLLTGTTLIEDKRSEKGTVWSTTGAGWMATNTNDDDIAVDSNGTFTNQGAGDIEVVCPTDLPNGAKITSVIVYGDTANPTWTFKRQLSSAGTSETLATASMNTADTTIGEPTINNSSYGYWIDIANLSQNEVIYGVRIEYDT